MALVGCQGPQSMMSNAGADAERVVTLWWLLLSVSAFVFFIVSLFTIIPFFLKGKVVPEANLGKGFMAGIVVTVVILLAIIVGTFQFSTTLVMANEKADIEVVGKLWWWEVIYYDEEGQVLFKTANEIHIPIDKKVRLRLTTDNVIHSFWVPSLGGKADMIPGRPNYLTLEAQTEGIYRGQCAEYCGLQHTFMAFHVVVEPEDQYQDWLLAQQETAPRPQTSLAEHGAKVFIEAKCMNCHTIRGFSEKSEIGPDLTHLMSRQMLASGTIPNNKGHLSGWIADPEGVKPSALMPGLRLKSEDFKALIHYLESLK